MEDIKIQNFKASHPETDLPEIRHLQASECDQLRTVFAAKLGLLPEASGLEILHAMEDRVRDITEIRPSDATFHLTAVFEKLGISARKIYINWYRFDDIDEMSTGDLDRWFHDFWYPDSDDIELFDQSQNWVLFVRHFDVLQIVRW